MSTVLCGRTYFVLLFSLVNHLTAPQIYLVTLWRGLTLMLGTTGLKEADCEVFLTGSTSQIRQ